MVHVVRSSPLRIRFWMRRVVVPTLVVSMAAVAGWPGATLAAEPLPACRFAQVQTRYTSYDDWNRTMLDTALRVPSTYAPPDLVDTATVGLNGGFSIRAVAADDLRAMVADAAAADAGLAVNSAYRSYARQKHDFHLFVQQSGWSTAVKYGARPGHSEHQLGLAIDFRSADSKRAPWNYRNWGKTTPGTWMRANAWRYGFVMSFPSGKRSLTCMGFEPWHYRYVGRNAAAAIRAQHLTTREYLWQTWETAP